MAINRESQPYPSLKGQGQKMVVLDLVRAGLNAERYVTLAIVLEGHSHCQKHSKTVREQEE